MNALNKLPLASIAAVFGGIGLIVALINGADYATASAAYGVYLIGCAGLGAVRNQAGHGTE